MYSLIPIINNALILEINKLILKHKLTKNNYYLIFLKTVIIFISLGGKIYLLNFLDTSLTLDNKIQNIIIRCSENIKTIYECINKIINNTEVLNIVSNLLKIKQDIYNIVESFKITKKIINKNYVSYLFYNKEYHVTEVLLDKESRDKLVDDKDHIYSCKWYNNTYHIIS